MSSLTAFVRLSNEKTTLIFDCQGRMPTLIYYGQQLKTTTTPDMLALLNTRQEAKCAPVIEPPISLVPTHGEGVTGSPGLEISGDADQWSAGFTLSNIEQTDTSLTFTAVDTDRQMQLVTRVVLDAETTVATFTSSIENQGESTLQLNYLNAASLALPTTMSKIKSFEGRWSNEFQTADHDLFFGSYVRENRRGKTSHDTFPGLIAFANGTGELVGECFGFHLGASANHKFRAEMMADGRSYVQFGELLFPGEVTLDAGESYTSPVLYAGFGDAGFSSLSQQFHNFIRNNVLTHSADITSAQHKPRPVHYNTWEGIYFDHDETTLKALADKVAPLGIERFVLDDGWFKGRRNDKAGLGDWTVDEAIYPEGLDGLIDHVTDKGMEFGIWFEPEMVNPDSDLYRAHPEWALHTKNNPHVPFRNQYVLDLTNPEVVEYLYKVITDVLSTYPKISYIKWDMNRDVNHPGNLHGKPAMHGQMAALYTLIDRVKAAHPGIEIESCCSGGGRVDLGILPHTDRFWTSDSNDALDRLYIQRGFSYFFPSEVMGAHVGPRDCHITGRNLPIEIRAAVSMFGHMGIEMDPRELTEHEQDTLKSAISLYKKYRHITHGGDLYRMDDDGLNVKFGYVSKDKAEGIFAYNSVKETGRTTPSRFYFAGLDADKSYTLERVWPGTLKEYSPSILQKTDGQVFSGEALMKYGMQMPVLFPQTSLIYTVKAV
jgi:alpha-galactosidase